jgi:hypothetical protein
MKVRVPYTLIEPEVEQAARQVAAIIARELARTAADPRVAATVRRIAAAFEAGTTDMEMR